MTDEHDPATPELALDVATLEPAAASLKAPARKHKAAAKKHAGEPAHRPSTVILVRVAGTGLFNSGIPDRDITAGDGLTDEQIELAVTSGTHTRKD